MINIEKNNNFYLLKADISYSEINYILKNNFKDYKNILLDGDEYDFDVGISNPITYIYFKKDEKSKSLTKNLILRKEISNILGSICRDN